mmetsp:Transcript_13356/g.20336  ORF Transcript_13356/g.20336 Transcript_13356/m.20336 type:complete len:236 (-) Transcript_13356:816-1523(-)
MHVKVTVADRYTIATIMSWLESYLGDSVVLKQTTQVCTPAYHTRLNGLRMKYANLERILNPAQNFAVRLGQPTPPHPLLHHAYQTTSSSQSLLIIIQGRQHGPYSTSATMSSLPREGLSIAKILSLWKKIVSQTVNTRSPLTTRISMASAVNMAQVPTPWSTTGILSSKEVNLKDPTRTHSGHVPQLLLLLLSPTILVSTNLQAGTILMDPSTIVNGMRNQTIASFMVMLMVTMV